MLQVRSRMAFHTFCNKWTEMENKQDVKDWRLLRRLLRDNCVCCLFAKSFYFFHSSFFLIGKIVMKGHNNHNSRQTFCWVNHVFVRLFYYPPVHINHAHFSTLCKSIIHAQLRMWNKITLYLTLYDKKIIIKGNSKFPVLN